MTRRPTRERIMRVAISIAVLAVLAIGSAAYLARQAPVADVELGRLAVEGLTFVGSSATTMGPSVALSNSLEDNWAAIDLFLHSDARKPLPEVAAHVDNAWTAYRVADQLWRMYEDGEERPLVSEVYAADRVIAAVPALRATVTGAGADARFDNTGMRAVAAFFDQARAETVRASASAGAATAR